MWKQTALAALVASCWASSAFSAEYVLDVSRIRAEYGRNPRPGDKPATVQTRSIEIDVIDGADFHTRVRLPNELIIVKGRVTKDENGKLDLKISARFLDDVKNGDALTGMEGEANCRTSIEITPGKAIMLGAIHTVDKTTVRDVICASVERRPANGEMGANRRKDLKKQYAELLGKASP